MKTQWVRSCTPLLILLMAMIATALAQAQTGKPCSFAAINGDCTLTINRTVPVTPPIIYVQHGHTVTVRVPDPLPFEHLSLDVKSVSEQVPQDQFVNGFSALTTGLGGFAVAHVAAPHVETTFHCLGPDAPRPLSGPQILDCQHYLASRAKAAIDDGSDASHPSLAEWATNTLRRIHGLFKPVPPASAEMVPATTSSWEEWKRKFDSGSVYALSTFDADDFKGKLNLLDVDIAEATDRKSANVRELATITAQEKTLQATLGTLTTLKQKMTALKEAVDTLDVEAGPLLFTIADNQPKDQNNIVQTWDLNAANKLAKTAGLIKADKYLDETSAAVSTLTDVPVKVAVAEFKIQFMNAPRFEISGGLLVPIKPYHTYSVGLTQASATAPPGTTPNCPPNDCPVVQQTLTNAVMPDVSVNFLLGPEHVVHQQRLALMWSVAAGYNTANTSAAFGFGLSVAWRSIVISPLAVVSRDQQLAGGYILGQSAGSATTPMTTNAWKFNPSIGVSLRIPLGGGSK